MSSIVNNAFLCFFLLLVLLGLNAFAESTSLERISFNLFFAFLVAVFLVRLELKAFAESMSLDRICFNLFFAFLVAVFLVERCRMASMDAVLCAN